MQTSNWIIFPGTRDEHKTCFKPPTSFQLGVRGTQEVDCRYSCHSGLDRSPETPASVIKHGKHRARINGCRVHCTHIQLLLGNYVKLWSFAEIIKQGYDIKYKITTYNWDQFMMGISIRQCWFTRCSPGSIRSLTMTSMNLSKGHVFIKNCQVEVLPNNSNIHMTCAFRWWLQPK